MLQAKIENHTHQLARPEKWDESVRGPCHELFIRAHRDESSGLLYLNSAWEPEPHEALQMLAGAKLLLGVAGQSHPPVNLSVGQMPDDALPVMTIRRILSIDGERVRVDALFPKVGRSFYVEVSLLDRLFPLAVAEAVHALEVLAAVEGLKT